MKVLSIVGARPQFIKLAPLSRELRKYHEEVIVHTGQHYDENLSETFFRELGIPEPDYNLGVGSGSHGWQTGQMLVKLEEVMMEEEPDLVIVFGDTNSTLAGALAASKLHVPLAHVEAGMRNFDKHKPEEINRVMTDHVSDYLFAVTKTAVKNLEDEGITENVYLVGDVTLDDFLRLAKEAEKKSSILEEQGLEEKKYLLLTIHKQKNTDVRERLEEIIKALVQAKETIVFPIHPRTRKPLKEYGLMRLVEDSSILLIEPVGYIDFIRLMSGSNKIITDSGGIQREAYLLEVPCITLRETEWRETVEDGWNLLADVEEEKILDAVNNFKPDTPQNNIFGEPGVCARILGILNQEFE